MATTTRVATARVVDRTDEFVRYAEKKRETRHLVAKKAAAPSSIRPKTFFAQQAASVAAEISKTTLMLKTLAQKAKDRQTPEGELTKRTGEIQQQITVLTASMSALKDVVDQRSGGTNENSETQKHSENLVSALNSQLKSTTSQFRAVLEDRNTRLKQQQERQGREFTYKGQQSNDAEFSFSSRQSEGSGLMIEEVPHSRQLLAEPSSANTSYLSSRAEAMRQIERTIYELSSVFQNMATLISSQDETIQRIDQDVEQALGNVSDGENHIAAVWRRTQGNRGLILKIFGVLIVFILLFVVIF
eukprot:TRINITY_DN759_c1_g1_i1.p1 TRINITY_DN759_c1_g1~~TRINITY_DN759_c1_g1_i1.p1  ORF type:complete len:302 (+),score=49.91 TRINITY_DN759_c1_g1_i1:67-972(+)